MRLVNNYNALLKDFWVCMCFLPPMQVTTFGIGGAIVEGMSTYLTQELEPNTQYTFQIVAINGFGDGVLSGIITWRTNFSGRSIFFLICCC